MNMTANIRDIQDMTELGDSVKRVDTLKEELENFAKLAEVSLTCDSNFSVDRRLAPREYISKSSA